MNGMTFPTRDASNKKSKRDEQLASTLVHYLGVEKALEVCRENAWTAIGRAIVERQAH